MLFYFIFFAFFRRTIAARRGRGARDTCNGASHGCLALHARFAALSHAWKREKITPVLQARNWRSPNFSTIVTINDQISKQKSGDSHEKLAVWPYFHSKDRDVRERIIVSRGECCFHETHRFLPPSPAQPKWKSLKDKSNITFMCLANNLTVLQFPLNSAADL